MGSSRAAQLCNATNWKVNWSEMETAAYIRTPRTEMNRCGFYSSGPSPSLRTVVQVFFFSITCSISVPWVLSVAAIHRLLYCPPVRTLVHSHRGFFSLYYLTAIPLELLWEEKGGVAMRDGKKLMEWVLFFLWRSHHLLCVFGPQLFFLLFFSWLYTHRHTVGLVPSPDRDSCLPYSHGASNIGSVSALYTGQPIRIKVICILKAQYKTDCSSIWDKSRLKMSVLR